MKEKKSNSSCESDACSAKKRPSKDEIKDFVERQALLERMCRIKHKILVLSGKGGVGKSTVAVNLAISLALAGKKVGLLDIDIHGPSIPKLLHLEGQSVTGMEQTLFPIEFNDNLKVMSIGFLIRNSDNPVIWRGPLKYGVIKQFLKDVEWGELDYLVIDSPPGTGDEPLSVCQLIEDADGAVIVTTPQDLAVVDVRKCISFCRTLNLPVLGVVENMSGFVCPHCGKTTEIFKTGGGEKMAMEMNVPFLGRVPLDPRITEASDQGTPYIKTFSESDSAGAFTDALGLLIAAVEKQEQARSAAVSQD